MRIASRIMNLTMAQGMAWVLFIFNFQELRPRLKAGEVVERRRQFASTFSITEAL